MPKGLEGVVGSLMIGVTDKNDDDKNKIDPTESIHKSHSPSREYAIRNATLPEKAPTIIGIKLGPPSLRNP
jgi:hypothetical protein